MRLLAFTAIAVVLAGDNALAARTPSRLAVSFVISSADAIPFCFLPVAKH